MLKKDWSRFKINFFEKCCELIHEVKPENKPIYLVDKKYKKPEDHITYDYVEAIKQIDIKEKIRVESSKQRIKDDVALQEPDITFSTLDNRLKTFFECKILGDNSKYVKDGIERFVIEKYAFKNMPFYGMLGYVRDNNLAIDRYNTLEKNITQKSSELNLTNKKIIQSSDMEVLFKTSHKTNKNKYNIDITHILHSWGDNIKK